MPSHERSAGFVLFRIDPKAGRRLFLLLDSERHWGFPKGHGNKGEDDMAAARRELAEETGIAKPQVLDGFAHEILYDFPSRKGLIHKTVIYFLAEASSDKVKLSDEHLDFVWLPFREALAKLTYENTREVLRAAEAFLAQEQN